MQLDETALHIFVDGSALPSPRRGGVGISFLWVNDQGDEVVQDEPRFEAFVGSTNNQMELLAVAEALKILLGSGSPVDLGTGRFSKVVVHTDSRYVSDNFTLARFTWPKTGWKTKGGAPVLNVRQWKELVKVTNRVYHRFRLAVRIDWVPGKSEVHTKRVDKLAKRSAKAGIRRPFEPQRVRRKWSPRPVEPGCVPMHGQEEIIRVVTDKLLKTRRTYHYMYEVVDPSSADYQKVDKAFSGVMLSAGHVYRVRLGTESDHPQIVEVHEELQMERPEAGRA